MKKSEKNFLKWVIGVAIFLALGGILPFVIKFWNSSISSKSQDWGTFGDYFGFVISVINTIVIGVLSYLVYSAQIKRDLFEKQYIEAEQKPALIFAVDANFGSWYIYNVGKGAALNVVVAMSVNQDTWQNPKKCYSLAPDEKFVITWFTGANRILGIYTDILSQKIYTSICMGDETSIEVYEKNILGPTHWINGIRNQATRL